jgi:hypothetical protein
MRSKATRCTNCRVRDTHNRGGICAPCLNGELLPDNLYQSWRGELLTEAETVVDHDAWAELRTMKERRGERRSKKKERGLTV